MRARIRPVSALLLAFLAVAASAQNPDDVIVDRVRLALTSEPDVGGGMIEVECEDGVVTMTGRIRTEKGKEKAEEVAAKVRGVKKVVNELVVDLTAP